MLLALQTKVEALGPSPTFEEVLGVMMAFEETALQLEQSFDEGEKASEAGSDDTDDDASSVASEDLASRAAQTLGERRRSELERAKVTGLQSLKDTLQQEVQSEKARRLELARMLEQAKKSNPLLDPEEYPLTDADLEDKPLRATDEDEAAALASLPLRTTFLRSSGLSRWKHGCSHCPTPTFLKLYAFSARTQLAYWL